MIGLFAALVGLAPVAVVFGLMRAREIERRPHESGEGPASAAIIWGVIEIVVFIIALAYLRT